MWTLSFLRLCTRVRESHEECSVRSGKSLLVDEGRMEPMGVCSALSFLECFAAVGLERERPCGLFLAQLYRNVLLWNRWRKRTKEVTRVYLDDGR